MTPPHSNNRRADRRLRLWLTLLAGGVALFVALAPGLTYALIDWKARDQRMHALAEVAAAQVAAWSARNPDIFRYTPDRAQAVVEAILPVGQDLRVDILDDQGAVTSPSTLGPAAFPAMSVTAPVMDFGVAVAAVRLTVSWRQEAMIGAGVFAISAIAAWLVFFPLRRLPLEAVERAEADLRDSEAALNRAQAVAHVGSWRMDLRGHRTRWSEETYRIFGVAPDAPVSPHLFSPLLHEDDRERLLTAWNAALAGAPYDVEHRIVRNGEVRWLRERAEITFDAQGRPAQADGTVEDVTDRRAAELRLRLAKEQAEVANRAKTALLANMSHELRTPLNAIIGLSEMMATAAMGPLGHPAYQEFAGQILSSGEQLLELVSDLLYAADLDAQSLDSREEDIDVAALVQSVADDFAGRARHAGVTIDLFLPDRPPRLRGDSGQIRRVLSGLLSNAVKASPPGARVALTVARPDDGGLTVAVTDHGPGMTEEELQTAMRPFAQVEDAPDRPHEGVGLGLPIAIGLTEAHGGRLTAQSVKGLGSTFTVALPAHRLMELGKDVKKVVRQFEPPQSP